MLSRTSPFAGLIYALSAFALWGLFPVFFKLLEGVNAFEVLAHRVVWSVLILTFVIQLRGSWKALRALPLRSLKMLFFSSLFISVNWLTFIWAVIQGRVLETSLGYFINPLITVLFGLIFLGERLRRWQQLAIVLAALGVMNQVITLGYLPWVALVLAFSFASYGLLRKSVRIEPIAGLFVETLLMTPFALVYFGWLLTQQTLTFAHTSFEMNVILASCGLITTVPLLLFAAGAQRLNLATLGIVQYLTPSMTFFLAVFLYREPFEMAQLITFSLIWAAVLIFTWDGLRAQRKGS